MERTREEMKAVEGTAGRKHRHPSRHHYLRFHLPHTHLSSAFGSDWFGLKAEKFARFFGTPTFLVTQTMVVAVWIGLNAFGVTTFDLYPFILLNLFLSMLAAIQAPVIMMSQNRQDAKDRIRSELDYQVNLKAELGVTTLLHKADLLSEMIDDMGTRLAALEQRPPHS